MVVDVCAYTRISTKKDDQLNSLENQRTYYEDYTTSKDNYNLYTIYTDSMSATTWKRREGFKQMLYDAGLDIEYRKGEVNVYLSTRTPKFKRILVKDVSRFARNIVSVEIIRKLRQKEVYIDFTNMNLSTQNMSEDMMLGMFMLFAENESKDRSSKVIFGNIQGAKNGNIRTGDVLFGYRYVKETKMLHIVKEEAEVVRKIYKWYLEGNGFRKIIVLLDDNKHFTRKGKSFCQQSVQRILSNPVYKGWVVRNKMKSPLVLTGETYAKQRPEEDWVVTKGKIEATISEEIYDEAQTLRRGKVNHITRKGVNFGNSEFAGLIFCGICGSPYVRNHEVKTGIYFYNCRLKKQKSTTHCKAINVRMDYLLKMNEDFQNGGLFETFNNEKDSYNQKLKKKKNELKEKIDQKNLIKVSGLNIELTELLKQQERIAYIFIQGKLNEEVLNKMQSDNELEITKKREEIESFSLTNEQIQIKIDEINNKINIVNNYRIKEIYSSEEILEQIDKIIVNRSLDNPNKPSLDYKFKIFKGIDELDGEFDLLESATMYINKSEKILT